MVETVRKKQYGLAYKPDCIKRVEKWEQDVPVVSDIIRLVMRNMLESDKQDKLSMMKVLRNIHEDFVAHRTDYYPTSNDEMAWGDVNTMELVLLDMCHVFHDLLAHDLGEPYLNDVLQTESDERFAEKPLGDDSMSVPADDSLPF